MASEDLAKRPAGTLTKVQARRLTEKIRKAVEDVWALLSEAHESKAWAALGYGSWEHYVKTEFDMSRQRSYQLLDQARVIGELAAGVSTYVDTEGRHATPSVDINEADARIVKPVLPEVIERARELIDNDVSAPEAVAQAVGERRAKVTQRQHRRGERRDGLVGPPTLQGQLKCLLDQLADIEAEEAGRAATAEQRRLIILWARSFQRSGVVTPAPSKFSVKERDIKPSECKHPVSRRLGDFCPVCESTISKAAK